MPDTVIRDGFECCQDGGYRTSRCPYCRYTMERPPGVVVTGRTAQAVEAAFWLFDGISQCGRDELLAMIAKRKEADRA